MGLMSKIHKRLMQLNVKQATLLKMAEDLNRLFKERHIDDY